MENVNEYIKVLNKEKVLEFKLNKNSGFEESEIIIQNNHQKNIISKIYINNYKNFKCSKNIVITPINSESKIKVTMDNKDYHISNSDVFLIISYPIDNPPENLDNKNLIEYFKNNECKEKGQKLFLIGYKKGIIKKEKKEDNLVNKIKELEKKVFEDAEVEKREIKIEKEKDEEIKISSSSKSSYINYLIIFGLLVLGINVILFQFLKK